MLFMICENVDQADALGGSDGKPNSTWFKAKTSWTGRGGGSSSEPKLVVLAATSTAGGLCSGLSSAVGCVFASRSQEGCLV